MAPRVDPVRSDETLPTRADVVIIGGGIIGTSTALFLAQKGISVALCEKGHIAGEQSSRNWGWCRKMGRDPREIPLIIESLRLWQGMNELVEAETGFRQAGIMYLAETQAELNQLEAWLEHARQYQLDTRIIGRSEAAELMPGLTGPWTGAPRNPSATCAFAALTRGISAGQAHIADERASFNPRVRGSSPLGHAPALCPARTDFLTRHTSDVSYVRLFLEMAQEPFD